ncbi:MAG: hypothetical protein OHK0039_16840 [Bacteroidia bacterium]
MKKNLLYALVLSLGLAACLDDGTEKLPTLVERLSENSSFSLFLEAMDHAGVTASLDGSLYYTLLVPTNGGFQAYLDRHHGGDFRSMPDTVLRNLIFYHLQLGRIPRGEFTSNYYASLAAGYDGKRLVLLVENDGASVVFNTHARMISDAVEAKDGNIFALDSVIVPPSLLDVLRQNDNFSQLLASVDTAGLRSTLDTSQGLTLLIPTDGAFEQYYEDNSVSRLSELGREHISDLARFHVVDRFLTYENMQNLATGSDYRTLLPNRRVNIRNTGQITFDSTAQGILYDLFTTNGVVHILNGVLEP